MTGSPSRSLSAAVRRLPWSRLAALAVFAVAMAFVEADVVYYLRKLFALQFDARVTAPGFHFPKEYLAYERAREAATIVMLVAVAWLAGRTWRERLAAYLFIFGVWDILYYVWLYVLLRWPSSPTTRDLLFLIPDEWFAPVWQPIAVSGVLIIVALALFAGRRPGAGRR